MGYAALRIPVQQVRIMLLRIALLSLLSGHCLLLSEATAEDRSVEEFVEYSAKRIANADPDLIKRFAQAVDRNGDGKVSDEEFQERISVYQNIFETVQPKPAQTGHSLPKYWFKGFEKGSAEAKKSSRPMLVMFSASWCAPCKMMIAQVFPDQQVQDALKGMVPVYVDSEVEVEVARENGIQAYPTFVCFSAEGNAISSRVGGGDVSKFLEMIETFKLAVDAVNVSEE